MKLLRKFQHDDVFLAVSLVVCGRPLPEVSANSGMAARVQLERVWSQGVCEPWNMSQRAVNGLKGKDDDHAFA